MTITKCDRCGEPIEHEPPEFYRVTVRTSRGCVANMRQDFDLCSTCRNKLVSWVQYPETGGREG